MYFYDHKSGKYHKLDELSDEFLKKMTVNRFKKSAKEWRINQVLMMLSSSSLTEMKRRGIDTSEIEEKISGIIEKEKLVLREQLLDMGVSKEDIDGVIQDTVKE